MRLNSYRFLCFAKKLNKTISEKVKKLAVNTDHAKQSATDAPKTDSKKAIQKTSKATDKITNFSRSS